VTNLRERKKQQTRRHIADVAARLFVERGFDEVTVDEVAQAAEVSRKTVFNYFPTKEDLVFSGAEDREAEMVQLIRERPPGVSLIEVFREDALRSVHEMVDEDSFPGRSLFGLAKSSHTLWRRALEIHARQERVIAEQIAAMAGLPDWDPVARTVAHTLLGAKRSVRWECQRRLEAGQTPAEVTVAVGQDVHRIFAVLEQGLAGFEAELRHSHLTRVVPPELRFALDEIEHDLTGRESADL
jgi:AcrR family transcriptional regulator